MPIAAQIIGASAEYGVMPGRRDADSNGEIPTSTFRDPGRAIIWIVVGLLAAQHPCYAEDAGLTAIPEAPIAPSFVLPDLSGRERHLDEFAGQPLVVNFWATWCPPCRAEMPSLQRAREALAADGIEVIAIDVGEDAAELEGFLEKYPVELPLLLDEDSAVTRAWSVRGLPTTYVLDGTGRMVYRAAGDRTWDDPGLLGVIRALDEADGDGPD